MGVAQSFAETVGSIERGVGRLRSHPNTAIAMLEGRNALIHAIPGAALGAVAGGVAGMYGASTESSDSLGAMVRGGVLGAFRGALYGGMAGAASYGMKRGLEFAATKMDRGSKAAAFTEKHGGRFGFGSRYWAGATAAGIGVGAYASLKSNNVSPQHTAFNPGR